jgi:hypothetical protein
MPINFFDVIDTGKVSPDTEGTDFTNLAEARHEALRTLGEIAKDKLPDGNRREFVIQIRLESGPPVMTASLSLHVQEHDPSSN